MNDYGIRSETVENYYLIDVAIPEKPEVTPSSGNYQLPTLIEVIAEEEGNIYYTTDGSEPDENSLQKWHGKVPGNIPERTDAQ